MTVANQAPEPQASETPTVAGAAPQATPQPVAPAAPAQQANEGAAATPEGGDSWEARYKGLQRLYQTTTQELATAQETATQASAHAGTLETQLATTQTVAAQAVQNLTATNAQLAEAQREAAYFQMVQTEFPELGAIAPALQRMDTPDAQRALFTTVRQQMGLQAAATANQQIAQNLAGATPGAGPVAGAGGTPEYSYEEVMTHVMDEGLMRRDPAEYQRWMDIYHNDSNMGHQSLGLGAWQDPFPNHVRSIQAALGQQPAPLSARNAPQTIDDAQPGQATGMPGAWGGVRPPNG